MDENRRDAGLVRAVGPAGLAASIINVVVGAGIFAVPAALAASLGSYAPIAFVVCAVVIGSVAICFAEGGSRVPTSGGVYGYIETAFGPLAGYVAGTMLWFSDLLACGGIAAALADVAASLLPPMTRAPARVVVIVGAVGGIALVNIGGVARGVRLINAATVLKLIPLVIFIIAGAGAIHSENFPATAQPGTADLGRALILALFAFTGMETALCASGEVAQPTRTIPHALAIAMLTVTLLYIGIQVIAQGVLGPALAQSTVPLADAMARINPTLRLLMLAGTALSMLGWLGSDILGTPRVLFAFARDGLMPRVLGRVHPRSHAPHVAIACYATLAIGLALTGTFVELAVLSTLGVAVPYILGCAAAWQLARRCVASAGAPLNFRWLGIAMVTAIASMLGLIALASRAEILGLIAALIISAALYRLLTWRALARQ
ncbi:APC family permease [Dokdonella soli]|uniref:Arginine/agmatine antiporter n=1 Tax=Dokdonella soli TaxID=529810 RepID=A0ABP3U6N8_9GAMM